MAVLIEGMEMPTSCRRCDFSQPDGCGFFCPITTGKPVVDSLTHSRHTRCPLVPVPEQHGRLIDADAMFKDICDSINEMTAIGVAVDGQWLWDKLNDALKNAPTIIPASGKE